jgi:hypothetical protein
MVFVYKGAGLSSFLTPIHIIEIEKIEELEEYKYNR